MGQQALWPPKTLKGAGMIGLVIGYALLLYGTLKVLAIFDAKDVPTIVENTVVGGAALIGFVVISVMS